MIQMFMLLLCVSTVAQVASEYFQVSRQKRQGRALACAVLHAMHRVQPESKQVGTHGPE